MAFEARVLKTHPDRVLEEPRTRKDERRRIPRLVFVRVEVFLLSSFAMMTLVLLFTSPLFGGRIQSSWSIFRRRNVFTTVRFFSLLSRLFLLERGAKREKQPPLPDYFCFQVVVVQTTARGKSFLLSFSDEANSNTTRRIESLGKRFEFSLSYLVSLIPYEKALSSLSCFFLSLLSRALLRRIITAFRRLYCCCCYS